MAAHRTLDEFGTPGEEADEPEPPEPTFRWEPAGVTCGSCGERVQSLWHGEYGLICAACKEW